MKKVISLFALVVATFVASADYLYWMIDTEDSSASQFTWDVAKLVTVDGSGTVLAETPGVIGSASYDFFDLDGVPAWHQIDIASYETAGAKSFLVELYNGDNWVAQSEALAFTAGASYIGGNIYNPQSGAWSASGFNVPEPTSGLLMLVGGMLLALKRRKMA